MASIDWNGRVTAYLQKTGVPTGGASEVISAIGGGCQAAAERLIGRTLDAREYVELYTGSGKEILFLNHDPIVSLAGVSIYGNVLTVAGPTAPAVYPPAQVLVNPTLDGLRQSSGAVWDDTMPFGIIVSYSAGLEDAATGLPPEDLLLAVTYWAAQLFRRRDRLGESSSSFGGQITAFTQEDVPPFAKEILEHYRRPFLPC